MGFAAGLLKALKCQEICLNNFHPSLSRIWPFLDFDNPATRDKPASSYRSEACIFFSSQFCLLWYFLLEGEDFLNIPSGARNGVENGLELLLDVEAFE